MLKFLRRAACGSGLPALLLVAVWLAGCGEVTPVPAATVTLSSLTIATGTSPGSALTAAPTATQATLTTTIPAGTPVASPVAVSPPATAVPPLPTGPVSARLGQPFELRHSQIARLESEQLNIKFTEVVNESRCPDSPRVACATAGRAVIRLEVSASGPPRALEMSLPGLTGSTLRLTPGSAGLTFVTTFENFRVQLVSLEPQPTLEQSSRVAPEAYRATLLVTRP